MSLGGFLQVLCGLGGAVGRARGRRLWSALEERLGIVGGLGQLIGEGLLFGGGAGGIGAGGFGIRFALGKCGRGLVGEVAGLFVGECMGLGGGLAGNILLGIVAEGAGPVAFCAAWAACVSWLAAWEKLLLGGIAVPWRMEFFTASAVLAAAWAWALAAGFCASCWACFLMSSASWEAF